MSEYLRSAIKSDRISIEQSKHRFFERLKEDDMPFSTMKDIFLAAAYFGAKMNKRESLKTKHQIFQKGTFKEDELVDLFALAISAESNANVLQEGNVIEIVEQLANGGIEELHDLLSDMDDPFEDMIKHMMIYCDDVVQSD